MPLSWRLAVAIIVGCAIGNAMFAPSSEVAQAKQEGSHWAGIHEQSLRSSCGDAEADRYRREVQPWMGTDSVTRLYSQHMDPCRERARQTMLEAEDHTGESQYNRRP